MECLKTSQAQMEKRTTHYAESNKEHSNLDDNNDSFDLADNVDLPDEFPDDVTFTVTE